MIASVGLVDYDARSDVGVRGYTGGLGNRGHTVERAQSLRLVAEKVEGSRARRDERDKRAHVERVRRGLSTAEDALYVIC